MARAQLQRTFVSATSATDHSQKPNCALAASAFNSGLPQHAAIASAVMPLSDSHASQQAASPIDIAVNAHKQFCGEFLQLACASVAEATGFAR
jgi:hypothetical protein